MVSNKPLTTALSFLLQKIKLRQCLVTQDSLTTQIHNLMPISLTPALTAFNSNILFSQSFPLTISISTSTNPTNNYQSDKFFPHKLTCDIIKVVELPSGYFYIVEVNSIGT